MTTKNDITNEPLPKRQKTSSAADDSSVCRSPCSFVTWNCNGFLTRCKNDTDQLERLIRETASPDLVCLQEVRCKAASPNQRHVMCRDDSAIVSRVFGAVFADYVPLWSLADKRCAGTCTLVHRRLQLDASTNSAFSTTGAIDLLLQKYNLTRESVGIAGGKTKEAKNKKQTGIQSFFSSNKPTPPNRQHHDQGRFQFLSFPDIDILHTYVPNHGMKPESFARRQHWDEQVLQFVNQRKLILSKACCHNRPLMWIGDLNVARDYRDGTHWSVVEENSNGDSTTVKEWWTDESKCMIRRPNHNSRDACHVGMPSFTPAERRHFEALLEQGDFTDVWRHLHPNGSTTHNHLANQWDRPDYTWRGALGKNGNRAKYQGKGQRLDYFLTSRVEMGRVEACEILGYGENREGLFCGSDHCASKLQLTRWTGNTCN